MDSYQNPPLEAADLPTIESIEFNDLHPRYPWLCVASTLVFWLILSVPPLVLDKVIGKVTIPEFAWLAFALVAIYSVAFSYFDAKAKGYAIRNRDMLYRRGVWWQQSTGVSFKRIQHIDITHGPLERHFAIASLKFYTAGGSSADLKISGLPKAIAEQTKQLILTKMEARHG